MNITSVLAEKKENSLKVKRELGILLKYKPLGLIQLNNTELTKSLLKGLKSLPAGFVVYIKNQKTEIIYKNTVITGELDNDVLSGFDFIVCDDDLSDIKSYIEKGITPITLRKNHLSASLTEFNPLKNEGNSFFFEHLNKWDIFYTIVRYMENYKFPFDNKNLVTNLLK